MKLPALLRTSVVQLTIVYAALFAVSVAALFAFIYWSTIGYLERQTDAIIQADVAGLYEQAERRGLIGLIDVIMERVDNDTEGRSILGLFDAGLLPVAGNVKRWPPQLTVSNGWVDSLAVANEGGGTTPVRAQILSVGPGFRLMVGRDVRELARINEVFRRAAIWGLGLTLGLALLGGFLVGQNAQRRIAQINRTTRQIIAGNLSQRVPVRGGRDEHDELARNLNAMLDQIEKLLEGIRHVGDSIAHDLRGPLTRLRNRLDTLAGEPQPSRDGLEECVAQADRLLETFSALLRIARVESGAYRSEFEAVDLAQIVRDVCELYQAAAEEHDIELACGQSRPDAVVFGDRELLAQALTNLLDNAVKYTPTGGRIDVKLAAVGAPPSAYVLSVADTGPGVPSELREQVLQRFARLDQSRSLPGNGLGLALVKAIAEQHEAELALGDNHPGLVVTLKLRAAGAVAA
ncbi:MAG TPA: HAMP domain-containing sensor histidine kinase [Gammaproteobacteria bacterium]|nr:HAMP domain-containing sensor histidine kinase [Gammaproteobacteria bacterium]